MQEDHEISATGYQHNMASWCSEKSETVLRAISETLRIAMQEPRSDRMEDIIEALRPAIFNATKLLSFSTGAQWSIEDVAAVRDRGLDGLESVLGKYGVLVQTSRQRLIQRDKEIVDLLVGDPHPSRTLLHEMIASMGRRDPKIEHLSERLEQVTMGKLSWADFTSEVLPTFQAEGAK